MKDSSSVDLKKRWVADKGNSARYVQSANSMLHPFSESPFGFYNDYADFRGFSSKDGLSSSDGLYDIKDAHIKKSDFSKSKFSTVHFSSCRFEGCLFDEAVFESDVRFWSQCEFVDCTFLNATFINCAFNSVRFLRCTFAGTKWKTKNVFSVCAFHRCLFSSNIKNIDFSDASFDHSKFRGVLQNVTFLGWSDVPDKYFVNGEWTTIPNDCLPNRMNGVDFSEAELILCTFSQYCNLDNIKPPQTDKNCAFFITYAFCSTLTSIIERQWKNTNAEYYRSGIQLLDVYYKPDNRTPATIVHGSDLSKKFGDDFSAQFYSLLRLAAKQANALIAP